MPANTKPVAPFTADRHLDLQADLHFFFDTLVQDKRVLDVGAGLGKSKARIRHNRVTTYEPSLACAGRVDTHTCPPGPFDVVTAFEVLEHVENDQGFLHTLDQLATQAVFLTTPNWHISQCQSAQHFREYTHAEFVALLQLVFPDVEGVWLWAYYKDAEGGWVDDPEIWDTHTGLKHVVLINKGLTEAECLRIDAMTTGRLVAVR